MTGTPADDSSRRIQARFARMAQPLGDTVPDFQPRNPGIAKAPAG